MNGFQTAAFLVVLSAILSYLNYRYVRLPPKIGVMLIALLMSLVTIAAGRIGYPVLRRDALEFLARIDFRHTLLNGMLAFLLFAGSLHVELEELNREKAIIIVLSTVGVAISTVVVGGGMWTIGHLLHYQHSFVEDLLFGALISPTDPIAVISVMKSARAPKSLEVQLAGESLFNDGIGVVLFMLLHEILQSDARPSWPYALSSFLEQSIGGVVFGLVAGFIVFLMLKGIDNYHVEILLTLALAMGAYALADPLPISAPIAVVSAGLLIGNHGRTLAMSKATRDNLDSFWELLDEILNVVLFVLIGLEMLVVPFSWPLALAGLLAIPVVMLARWISVAGVIGVFRIRRPIAAGSTRILTWAGLRGGISVALALSLAEGAGRDLLLTMTYAVVVFSITAQGLTVGRLTRRFSHGTG